MNIKVFAFITFLTFNTSSSIACVWQPSPAARYWPSTSISVCFISQTMEAENSKGMSFSSDLTPSRQLITQAIQEMSDKTRFNFSGFEQCDPTDTSPMIRIKLDRTMRGEAVSIGPESSQSSHNLEVSQLPTETSRTNVNDMTGEIQTINYLDELKSTTQHELMHLLGFHHDHERASKGWGSFSQTIRTGAMIDPNYDRDSIMAAGERLSTRDIQCLNRLAIRTARNTQIRLSSNTPTNAAPSVVTTQEAPGIQ